jgi:hypothetical protein
MELYFRTPFPEDNIFQRVMAIRSAYAFLFFKYSYTLFLYTTPYIVYSILLSGIYIFALKAGRKIRAGKLPLYPTPRKRTELSLAVGEIHYPRKQLPSETPRWLVIPERGLFTGIAIVGAVGSGKTASCMYPFAEQILAYHAEDLDRRIGGLILEVKGDFCGKVRGKSSRGTDAPATTSKSASNPTTVTTLFTTTSMPMPLPTTSLRC